MNTTFRLLAVALTAVPLLARADTLNFVSAKDNTLYQDQSGGLSNGAGQFMFAGLNGGGGIRRALFAFDLAAIPAGSAVASVSLQLHMSRTASGATSVGLHRVLADWGEGASDGGNRAGGGASAAPGDATWLHTFYATTFWSSSGGDFAAAESAATSVDGVAFYQWGSTAGMVADVQAWVNTPAANYGWALLGDESSGGDAKRFDTRASNNPAFFPTLSVTFTAAPEPGSLSLLASAAALLLCRRRGR